MFQVCESGGRQMIDHPIAAAQSLDKILEAGIVTDDHDARSGIGQMTHGFRQFGDVCAINCWFDRQRFVEIARSGGQIRCL